MDYRTSLQRRHPMRRSLDALRLLGMTAVDGALYKRNGTQAVPYNPDFPASPPPFRAGEFSFSGRECYINIFLRIYPLSS